jgi:DNA-binding CsgD family transcriptional regulator/tetratricopeptide (TPR) repeat protein
MRSMGTPAAPLGRATRLVDRAVELASAERALTALHEGERRVLAVSGEPGIGKTRFARELAAVARRQRVTVVWGRATRGMAGEPLAALALALDGVGRVERSAPETTSASLLRRMRRLAKDGPVLLVVDEVQELDEASCTLVADLISAPASEPLLIVPIGVRGRWPDAIAEALRVARQRGELTDVALGPLTTVGMNALLSPDLDAAAQRQIRDQSGGNPRYALELQRNAGQRGMGIDARLPSSLTAAIAEDVESLSPPARDVLRAAAVVGRTFETAVATAVSQIEPRARAAAVAELVRRGFVARAADGLYRFPRPILQRVVYEDMGLGARAQAHERAAAALAALRGPLPARAHHVEHGANGGSGAATVLLAAAASQASSRPATASRWYAAALRKMDDADERRHATLMEVSTELLAAGHVEEGRRAFEEARAIAVADPPELRALLCAAQAERMLVVPGRTRPSLERALNGGLDEASAAAVRIALATEHWRANELDAMEREASSAQGHARRSDDRVLRAHAGSLLALARYARGAVTEARADVTDAQATIRELGDDQLAGALECLLVLGHASCGLELYATAEATFQRGVQLARSTDHRYYEVALQAGAAAVVVAIGKLALARTAIADATRIASEISSRQPEMWVSTAECMLAAAVGDAGAALASAERTTHAADRLAGGLLAVQAQCTAGAVRIGAGAPAEGREQILRHAGGTSLARLDAGRRPGAYAALASAALELGDAETARGWVELGTACAEDVGLAGCVGTARAAQARLLAADGSAAQAIPLAEEAVERFTDAGRAVDAGRAAALAGHLRSLSGDDAGALAAFERAHAVLASCEADRHRDLVAHELRRLGKVAPRHAFSAPTAAGLTPRETEVAELVAQGLTNRRIAEELAVSARTVEDHLKHAFEKLGVPSRAALAAALEAARKA